MTVGIMKYDRAVRDLFSGIRDYNEATDEYDGSLIPVIVARPDRAFASWAKSQDTNDNHDNVPLPMISIWRQEPEPDPSRSNTVDRRYINYFTRGDYSRRMKCVNFLPYNINYQVELWCRDIFAENAFSDWVRWTFVRGFQTSLPIDFDEPFGVKNIPIFARQAMNNTDIEPGEDSIGYRRYTYVFEVRGWMHPPATEVPTIFGWQLDFILQDLDGSTSAQFWLGEIYTSDKGAPLLPGIIIDGSGDQSTSDADQDGEGTVP